MPTEKKGIIIAGGGARGLFFTQMLAENLHRKVVAIIEPNTQGYDKIKSLLLKWGTPSTQIFSSLDKALTQIPRSMADIVFIMTPEWTHLAVFTKAVQAQCHIFLEKPIATTDADIRKMVQLANNAKTTIQIGFVLRYSDYYQTVKKLISDNEIGQIVMIQMNERLSLSHHSFFCRSWHRKIAYTGGFLNEKCSHDLDIMLWLKGEEHKVDKVSSFAGRHFTPPKDTPSHCSKCEIHNCPWRFVGSTSDNEIDGKPIQDDSCSDYDSCVFHSDADIYDHQSVNFKFTDGTQGVFNVVTSTSIPGRDIRVFGTDGYLEGQLEKGHLLVQNYWRDKEPRKISLQSTDHHGGGDESIIKGFLESIEKQKKPLSTIIDGVRASLLAFAADQSAKQGQIITFKD